jgi:hypothetical protein
MRYQLTIILTSFFFVAKSQLVYKTPSGNKYHLATCRMVNNVSSDLPLSKALKQGLAPCKICKPPIYESTELGTSKSGKGISNTVQCKGLTKTGRRCRHRTSIANGFCFQHNPDKN